MQIESSVPQAPEFLSGGGEMGALIRSYNWASTPLGPVATWPQSLRTCIRIMLTSRQPIWIGWGRDLIKFYNDPYKAIAGGKHPWALGKPVSEVWKDIWEDIEPMLKQVMEQDTGTYVESQLLLMERNGYPEETYYTFSYTPIPGDDGKTEGVFCANTDDTDKIISERQLRTLTQLGQRLSDCRSNEDIIHRTISTLEDNPHDFPFALFYSLTDNKVVLANATPLGESVNVVPAEIDLKADDELAQVINDAITTRKPQLFKELMQKMGKMPVGAWKTPPDNAILLPVGQTGAKEPYGILVVGLNPHRLLDEKYSSFFSLVADQVATSFADVHVLEEERKRVAALAEIDKAKTAFFSNISHEFRTPLTLMLAPIEDSLNDPNTIDENRERLGVAHRNVQRLLKLVNNLLDFSRIEAGRMEASFELVNLSEVTRDLSSVFQSAMEKAGLAFQIDCEDGIDAYVDIDMWEKIVLNLLSNALKYTRTGSIAVTLRRTDGKIKFAVRDTGIGIPEQEQAKVFERFHRIHNTQGRSQEGTGIGLSLVQELVRLHQGAIELQSKPGQGSVFTITLHEGAAHLPAGQVVSHLTKSHSQDLANVYIEEVMKWMPASEPVTTENTVANETIPLVDTVAKPKVLLADDNTDMRNYVHRLLSTQYDVTSVGSGRQVLEVVGHIKPDLIISDVMMPEIDGFELVKILKSRQDTKHTPVILLSARAGEEATIEGLQTGADDYLVKPFSAKELLSRVNSSIRIAQSRIHSVRLLFSLFMNAPVPIAILRGAEQRFDLANEGYREIVGWRDVVGQTVLEALPELVGTEVPQLLNKVYTTGEPFTASEYPVILVRNGENQQCFFNFIYSPLIEEDRTISGVMVVAIDVTEMVVARKVLEDNETRLEEEVRERTRALIQANGALERSNKELEQYAYITSHDLQEPLRKIQTFADMAFERNKTRLDASSVMYFSKITNAAKRMSGLINDLLNFSLLSKEEQFVPVNLNEILENVLTDFELLIRDKKAVVLKQPLPQIEAIPLQMNQLFGNLISNALKFTSQERIPEIQINVRPLPPTELDRFPSLVASNEYVEICIVDNGIGFDKAYATKIFEIFQRLNGRNAYEGTGIGLALCNRIVANHHGIIYAESEEGAGAKFCFILPEKQQ